MSTETNENNLTMNNTSESGFTDAAKLMAASIATIITICVAGWFTGLTPMLWSGLKLPYTTLTYMFSTWEFKYYVIPQLKLTTMRKVTAITVTVIGYSVGAFTAWKAYA